MTEEQLDKKSWPLRKAIEEQARKYGCGFMSGWVQGRKSWVYTMSGRLNGVEVVVVEDGSDVFFTTDRKSATGYPLGRRAKSPRGVGLVFGWLMAMLYPLDGLRRSNGS